MGIGDPEARHRSLVSSKDSNKIDLLHLGPGRGRRVVCSIGWEEKNKVNLHVLTAAIRVPTKRILSCNQESIIIGARRPEKRADIRRLKTVREVIGSPNQEDTVSKPQQEDLLTGRIQARQDIYGSGNPKIIKLFQQRPKKEKWAMPTWCYMFNSTLTENPRVWFDKLPRESIDSYKDLRIAFRENYLQQTKHIKDPVEIHHIKQRDGESTEDFMEIYKAEILDVEGAPECMKISGFMHGICNNSYF
ncbi:reverse transcriptase domain-containing protein [Tanacetum coccineum]|uniref:Reverse transcriptase domain-containing protein n=1 Tax=Tanacetum coccineum TaxID=301880 RepID=A0ABQ5E7P8_9ASTR